MKPGTPLLRSTRLLDQVSERIRYMHYSLKTEKAYLYWVRFFIRWSATQPGGMRHPRDMGVADVEAFLSMMANERKVSASTHNQALSALLFLYREVLNIDLPWLNNIGRPQQAKRIPSVLTKDEVAGLLAQMDGITALLARLLYGTGMRLMEGMRLRVKDVEFDRHVVIVREAKGGKDRVVMLPRSLAPALRLQMLAARALWEADRRGAQAPSVRRTIAACLEGGRAQGGHSQTCIGAHLATLFRHPLAARGHRYSNCSGIAGPCGRGNDGDLHPRTQGGCWRYGQSAGCPCPRALTDRFVDLGRRTAVGRFQPLTSTDPSE